MKFDDVLLALILRKPISGYEAKKWLDVEGVFIRANADQSQIYRTLHRLQRKGFIEYVVEPRDAAPDAKVYSGTRAGAAHLLALSRTPYRPPARWQEPDFTLRYTLLGVLSPASLLPLIDTELHFRREQVAQFRYRERRTELQPTLIPIDPELAAEVSEDAHAYGTGAMDAWIAWLEEQRSKWAARLGQNAPDKTVAAGSSSGS